MRISLLVILACYLAVSCTSKSGKQGTSDQQWWSEADRALILSELDRTTNTLKNETIHLTEAQYNFREDNGRWSIIEIIEHLELQNLLHYREISATSLAPQYLEFRRITEGQDAHFTKYSTDTTRSKAKWYLEPRSRYKNIEDSWKAFFKARNELKLLVKETQIDLRKQFTFRAPVEGREINELKIGQVRDLHQLLLTGIAHTDRHITQIQNIKKNPDYPSEGN